MKDLVSKFREAAIIKGDGREGNNDSFFYKQMSDTYHQLVNEGSSGVAAFEGLMNDESPYVRSWVAAQLLFNGNKKAKQVLEVLVKEGGLIGLSAEITLQEYESGNLQSPL